MTPSQIQSRIGAICRLANDPDPFEIPCFGCGAPIPIPAMDERQHEAGAGWDSASHLRVADLACPACGGCSSLVFPMRREER